MIKSRDTTCDAYRGGMMPPLYDYRDKPPHTGDELRSAPENRPSGWFYRVTNDSVPMMAAASASASSPSSQKAIST